MLTPSTPPKPPTVAAPSRAAQKTGAPPKENVKETIISVIIAFAMAFVFRSFVAEAFIIPTGSMAPTLNGAHMRFTSKVTGRDWAVAPWFFIDGSGQNPHSNQSQQLQRAGGSRGLTVHDPLTGSAVTDSNARARAGDRIFVLKYLYLLMQPSRYDVVVFKNPTNPDENYIKRLIGLPGEQIAIVDGDVFARTLASGGESKAENGNLWAGQGWSIKRKDATAQRAVWQEVFDSSVLTGQAGAVRNPWNVEGGATVGAGAGGSTFVLDGQKAGAVWWDKSQPFMLDVDHASTREINDRYPYNENPSFQQAHFPVGDLRIRARARLVPGSGSTAPDLTTVIQARNHRFAARIGGGRATLTMRPLDGGVEHVLAQGPVDALSEGGTMSIEFWHADQTLQLWVNGRLVLSKGYDWAPMERLRHSLTDKALDMFNASGGRYVPGTGNVLLDPAAYRPSGARIECQSAPGAGTIELRAVGLDRDLFYRPGEHQRRPSGRPLTGDMAGTPGTATHPASTITLGPDQYFVCGDNSPQSLDGRLWAYPDPWVAAQFDPSPSVVSGRLMMGKAFFVYFPAPVGGDPVGVPDFGRLRFIR